MANNVTLDNLIRIKNQLVQDHSHPVRQIEFNPKDFKKIRKIFEELFPNEIIQRYKIDDKKFKDRFEPYVLFAGIRLIENKAIERNYLNIVY